jgi:hypothetical protein
LVFFLLLVFSDRSTTIKEETLSTPRERMERAFFFLLTLLGQLCDRPQASHDMSSLDQVTGIEMIDSALSR